MAANERIEIPLSKTKISMLLIASVAFVVLGIFFTLTPETFISPVFRNPVTIRVAGVAAATFFGLCGVFLLMKYLDNKAGLIIDQYGITDNTSGTSVGLIEWEDITGIQTVQVVSTRILMILTDKPDKYIDRAKTGIVRRAMKMNHKTYGSPLSIISGSLKINFDELERLVTSEFEKRKNSSAPPDLSISYKMPVINPPLTHSPFEFLSAYSPMSTFNSSFKDKSRLTIWSVTQRLNCFKQSG